LPFYGKVSPHKKKKKTNPPSEGRRTEKSGLSSSAGLRAGAEEIGLSRQERMSASEIMSFYDGKNLKRSKKLRKKRRKGG